MGIDCLQIYHLVFVFFVDINVIYIQTLADDVEAEATTKGEANKFLP